MPDEEESFPISSGNYFDFRKYSDVLAEIVKGSRDRYSIGIYGEWGSGKTTLMRLIEKKLKPIVFVWQDIKTDNESKNEDKNINEELKKQLKVKFDNYDLTWIDELNFERSSDSLSLQLSDKSYSNKSPSHFLSITLDKEKGKDPERAIVRIDPMQNVCEFREFRATFESQYSLVIRENDILTVWFNAWRYESEKNYALVPLMKSIAYALGEHPMYKELKAKILRGLAILGQDILSHYAQQYFMTEKGVQEFKDNFTKKLAESEEFDKDVIYFEGIKKIQDEMQKILTKDENKNTKIVIFIDDLDRCSPEKALEVFESIKIFFDMPGFIFIIGLSQQALNRILQARFKKMGISGITPEQYIRKIIQVEVKIEKWTDEKIKELIKDIISEKLETDVKANITENIDLIMKCVELNPREVKRFINKFIVFLKAIYDPNIEKKNGSCADSKKYNDPKKYLLIQALRKNWKYFYIDFFDRDLVGDSSSDPKAGQKKFYMRVKDWLQLKNGIAREYHLQNVVSKKEGELDTKEYVINKKEGELDTKEPVPPLIENEKDRSLFSHEPFWRELITMRSEFMDEELWEFLRDNRPTFGVFDANSDEESEKCFIDLEKYKDFSESSEVAITASSGKVDMDLISRRRNAYLDLWPRFKLLISDFEDVEMKFKGRDFVKTYKNVQVLFEKLQNWYFDGGGYMLMSETTSGSYYAVQREMNNILKKGNEAKKNRDDKKGNEAKKNRDDKLPLPEEQLKRLKEKVKVLVRDMSIDITESQQ